MVMYCGLGKWIWYFCVLFQHLCSASAFECRQHGHGEPMNWKTGGLRLVKNQFRLYLIVCL